MRVLALCTYPVEAASTRYRLQQFVEPLAGHGITLVIRPFLDSQLFTNLYRREALPRNAVGLITSALLRVGDVIRARDADVLFVQREAMMVGPPAIEWLSMKMGRCPMVLDLDDSTYVSYVSPTYGRWGSALKWFRKTNDLISWAKVVTCGNRAIADYVTGRGKEAVIIPTVVDTDRFVPRAQAARSKVPVIGWIGTHSTYQYLASVFPALERLARTQRFCLKVIGAGREEITIPGVEVENLPWNLDREVADFQSFDIGIYPIVKDEWSEGKSGFKAIQYMAVGLPFVTTPVGACAEIGQPGVTHFVAETEDEWVAGLSKLLSDRQQAERMGAAGRRYALEHYTVDVQAAKLAQVFNSVRA
ncbi:MAG TPA: glycosyltransferase [Pyrinomonadaceae bacterium]|nr:glycosyltransferase [Pyrinomonadaceae bacterium]